MKLCVLCVFAFNALVVLCKIDDDKVLSVDQFRKLRTDEMIDFWGYPHEVHKVQTEDGYILTNFRIPNPGGYPILMLHGLTASSDCWLVKNPNEAIVFLLWKKGYDVWLWNARGNVYSQEHVTLSNSDPEFYDFSLHEMGIYDTSASIDHILKKTGQKAVISISHSSGTVNVLILSSMRPEYQAKVRLNVLFAQTAYIGRIRSRYLLNGFYSIYKSLNINGDEDFLQMRKQPVVAKNAICFSNPLVTRLCLAGAFQLVGSGSNQPQESSSFKLLDRFPTGSSLGAFRQTIQNIRSGQFQPLDWGPKTNLRKYGVKKVPPYPLANVTVPTAIYYGCCNDYLSDSRDTTLLKEKLPNVVRFYQVPYEKFSHVDYLLAKDSYELLYKDVLDLIDKYRY